MIFWLFVACGSKQPAPVSAAPTEPTEQARTVAPATTEKQTAPVRLARIDTPTGSQLQLVFDAVAEDVSVEAWGASGLEIGGDGTKVQVGRVQVGQELTVDVPHRGAGDLAVRIAGSWSGDRGDDVRSFTIGDRQPTEVPSRTVDGRKVKGWEATPR